MGKKKDLSPEEKLKASQKRIQEFLEGSTTTLDLSDMDLSDELAITLFDDDTTAHLLVHGLEKLDLHDNELNSLPENICKLWNLKILDISQNNLRTDEDTAKEKKGKPAKAKLPESFANLVALECFYISYENIAALPDNTTNLSAQNFPWWQKL